LSEEDENETMFIRKLVRKQEVVDPINKGKANKQKVLKTRIMLLAWMESG
jgi:hypothetical protein